MKFKVPMCPSQYFETLAQTIVHVSKSHLLNLNISIELVDQTLKFSEVKIFMKNTSSYLPAHKNCSVFYSLLFPRSCGQEALLLRGAVFYISMSMWGVRRVNLELSFASVLPSIKQVFI